MSPVERIQRIFSESLAIAAPAATTDVIETGLIDSLALVMLLFEIEQEFAITIPLEGLDIDSLRTVERIVALVEALGARA